MRAACGAEMIGESVVPAAHVAPGFSSAKILPIRSASGSARLRSTSRREPATHTCPALPVIAPAMRRATSSRRGASAKTICGLLPPSSSVTGLVPLFAHAAMIDAPVRVEPVKVTLLIFG
jgi:hypothetical protein